MSYRKSLNPLICKPFAGEGTGAKWSISQAKERLCLEKPVLAIVAPCYNEEVLVAKSCNVLLELLNELIESNQVSENSFISIVDDGSTDSSWKLLNDIAKNDKRIRLLRFICNFGHQKALLAGLTENKADIYITLDFDLQDDISVIKQMIDKYKNLDIDIVFGKRQNRKSDSFCKKFLAQCYYKLSNILGVKQLQDSADFRLVSDNVVEFLRQSEENNLYLRGLLYELNFRYEIITYERKLRIGGTPKYTFLKSLNLAINGLTSSNYIIRLINIPALLCLIISIIKVNSVFFVGSLNLFAIAIVGEYISKIYSETKNRPNYVLAQKINYQD